MVGGSTVFAPSITWIDDAVWFEEGEETRRWSGGPVETIAEPGLLSQPRGGTVNGDFGSALRIGLPVGVAVAFVRDDSVETCGPFENEIFTIEPHVRDGVLGCSSTKGSRVSQIAWERSTSVRRASCPSIFSESTGRRGNSFR